MFDTPILFIVFNRSETTSQVFESIRQTQPRHLFIAADGPRGHILADRDRCEETRRIVHQVDWECDVHTLFQESNLGCRFGPSTAISWFFDHVEQGIILEDDCLPDPSFFPFCDELLDRYKDNPTIFSINGSNLGYSSCNDSYCFSRFMNMWGWATWRRVARLIDYDMLYWQRMKYRKLWLYRKLCSDNYLDIDLNWVDYWDERIDWLLNGFSTWDYQWVFHQLKYESLSIVPARNLVTNIGFGENATHTHDPNYPTARIQTSTLQFPLQHPSRIRADKRYHSEIIKKVWCCEYKREPLMQILARRFNKR